MIHSQINIYEDLLKQSLGVPDLVSKAANKDTRFLRNLDQWLLNTEEIMKKHNIPKCSEVAGLRSKIIADSYADEGKSSKRKRQFSIATAVIYDAQGAVLGVLEPIKEQIEEARGHIRQLLGVAYQTNMVSPNMSLNQVIQSLWATFTAHEQLKGVVANILVLVSQSDAMRLLAEEIDITIFKA